MEISREEEQKKEGEQLECAVSKLLVPIHYFYVIG